LDKQAKENVVHASGNWHMTVAARMGQNGPYTWRRKIFQDRNFYFNFQYLAHNSFFLCQI
jgi:hypothetical protein